jgi:dynactin complex subunit
LGKRVLVNGLYSLLLNSSFLQKGHFGGILRYMGPVQGKQGIFFGVELDQPVGKNDGTHQGEYLEGRIRSFGPEAS